MRKELSDMLQHRGLLAVLALIAVIGFAAGDCRAETITLTVSWSGHVFTATGTAGIYVGPGSGPAGAQQILNINVGALNSDLAGFGSAYSFSNMGVQTNWPGTSTSAGGFLLTAGTLAVGTTGTAGLIKVTATEGGYTTPSASLGVVLATVHQANFTGTTAGTDGGSPTPSYQSGTGSFTDSGGPPLTVTSATLVMPSNGMLPDGHTTSDTKTLGPFVTPYTLTTESDFNLVPRVAAPGSDGFSAQVSVITVPEPASMVMFLTSMPVPFVIVGWLGLRGRRRVAAA
jgi:hypothetical protein